MKIGNCGPIERLVPSENSRYTINHLYFDAENGRLVATNGHALLVVPCQAEPGDLTGLISVESILDFRKMLKASGFSSSCRFTAEKEQLVLEDTINKKRRTYVRPVGDFPNYANLIPDVSGPPTISFNPHVLRKLVEAMPYEEVAGRSPGGEIVESVSLWVVPELQKGKEVRNWKGADGKPTNPPTILVKASAQGALGIFMPVTGVDEQNWNTKLPKAAPVKPPVTQPTSTPKPSAPSVAVSADQQKKLPAPPTVSGKLPKSDGNSAKAEPKKAKVVAMKKPPVNGKASEPAAHTA
jgi:hypothetical protein